MTGRLTATDLVKHYPLSGGLLSSRRAVHAVDGVSIDIAGGETLAVVGESGCGKSTLARCLMRLEEPTAGRIELDGIDITHLSQRELRPLRRRLQIIFQDPFASLNGRWSVGAAIADALRLHAIGTRRDRRDRTVDILGKVGLGPEYLDRYPHELSGGQRQRVAIARAIAVEPSIIICDEPVSALDVSIQAQVLNLLKQLQRTLGLSYLFISHDLQLVRSISDRVVVMYLGQIVEAASAADIRTRVLHPYSIALFSAAPVADPEAAARPRLLLTGDPPSPIDLPSGCRFHPRCPFAQTRCRSEAPQLREVAGRMVRCHFAGEIEMPTRNEAADA